MRKTSGKPKLRATFYGIQLLLKRVKVARINGRLRNCHGPEDMKTGQAATGLKCNSKMLDVQMEAPHFGH